jgi:hypothetical protein
LRAVDKPEALLNVVCRYIQFQRRVRGRVLANLSGEIAARQGLFRDREEPIDVIADRAAEVASDFFHAAVDEYDDRATPWRDTHRTLAQACFKGLAAFHGFEASRLNEILVVNKSTHDAMARVSRATASGEALGTGACSPAWASTRAARCSPTRSSRSSTRCCASACPRW